MSSALFYMMKKRGQTSTEVIVLLGLILIILLSIISFREDVLSTVTRSYHGTKARSFIDSVTQSAESVYHQGSGARKVIYVTVPREIISIDLGGEQMNVSINISGTETKYYRKTGFILRSLMS